ncbi:MAG TPA: efflux RND transporter permease subunit [Anaerolineae bacterium]|jgi:CzcA family heavy metal efflux pump|nr:efflux RND transporter permease subunit [Anaerolineae bacterium]
MSEMRWIIATSLRYRYLVVFIAAVLLIFGISQIGNMSIDVFPEFAPPRVEIQSPAIGLSSVEVEALITVPLEEVFNGMPGLDVMRSKSVNQLSSILLIFEPGTDLMEARQLVQERLAIVNPQLPKWATPPLMMPPLSSTARTVKIGISSDEYSVIDLSMITYWKIREQLLRVPGVANVAMWGEQIRIPMVQVQPELLAANDVTLEEVLQVTSDTLDVGIIPYTEGSTTGTGGFLETPNQRLPIRHVVSVLTPEDLAQVPINYKKNSEGDPLRLDDIGQVVEDTWPMIGDAVVNDGEGLLLIIEKFPWANTVEVTNGVEDAMAQMEPGLPGIDFDTTIFRPATFVELSIENLTKSLLIGAILVVVVLLLFLWDWRIALISATIIPLTVVITLLILSLFGTTLNVMVLAGLVIALGAVVDDAIVDVENIVRRLRQERREGSDKSAEAIVLDASLEVRNAIVYASLIEMTALLPVFFLEGLSGAFFQPLAQAYVVAALVSPLVALTVTPALVLILISNAPLYDRVSPVIPPLHRGYERLLIPTLRRPRVAYAAFAAILLIGIIVYPMLGSELLPSFKERDFLMHWLGKPGTGHEEMVRISQAACQELQTIPGVRNCGSHIGQALLMDEVYGIYFGENWVSVDPSVDYDETLASIQSLVDGYPGLYRDVQTYLKERIREVLTGSSHPIVVRIYGEDMEVLRLKAAEIEEKLAGIEGLTELHTELLVDIPQIQVEVDLERAQQYGLKPGDVRRSAAYMIAGEEVGDIHIANRTFDVNVWSTEENRDSFTAVQNLLIDTPTGDQVRLQEVADVRIEPIPNAIYHEDLARRLHVEADVEGRDLGSVVAEVEEALQEVDYPLGYNAVLLGEFAERQAASGRLMLAAIAAALVILLLLRISVGSWLMAFLSFLSLPAALVGGVLAAFIFSDGVISLGSMVGFLTILGVAARNGIMMINHYQHLEEEEGVPFGRELVMRGSKERIAPIMMTALTAGLALVPLVVAGNIPGHEIEHPMAIVILGGLVTSTLLNLFVLPALYLRFGKGQLRPTPIETAGATA